MLNEADPTAPESDPIGKFKISFYRKKKKILYICKRIYLIICFTSIILELQQLEQQVNGMGPLIDAELELVDRR